MQATDSREQVAAPKSWRVVDHVKQGAKQEANIPEPATKAIFPNPPSHVPVENWVIIKLVVIKKRQTTAFRPKLSYHTVT